MAKPKFESDQGVLDEFDEDQNGELSETENIKAIESIRTRREIIKVEMLATLRLAVDVDQDGEVSPEEIKGFLRSKHQDLKEKISEANTELRTTMQEMMISIREACPSTKTGGPKKNAEDVSDESLEEELSSCQEAKDLASEDVFAAKLAKKELIKDMIAEMQAIIQSFKEELPESDLDEGIVSEDSNEKPGSGNGNGKGNGKPVDEEEEDV